MIDLLFLLLVVKQILNAAPLPPAVAGTLMNVLSYYTNRLLVPTVGCVLFLAAGGMEMGACHTHRVTVP